ncbi:FUSC family protein [Legionella maioricensis]|uniref:FUSC family protein n=1 Tax=Legionella maioricensis TaxID=2896528 RepID=A0A9X2D1U9_9GAMM|nr:FUSC family protein [Legionella maioricensis]MCL9684871.1 FUSC family protein [Legionella maioricensis]MCL9688947.1 FUSC family protein [Legionella maioricensis]
MRRSLNLGKLSYRSLRGIQISTVFFFTIIIQQLFHYPRAGWTGFAVMMIYAGFDNGTTILRAYHRFLGMLLGLFSGYLLWFLGHVDYRLLILIIPITIYFAYFLAGQAYSVPTVFTVNTSVIGTGYFDTSGSSFNVTNFLIDYLICTVIAFAIILVFEYFWFSRYRLMDLFIKDTQTDVIRKLYRLIHLLNQDKIRRSDWFEACITFTDSLFEMEKLARNSQFIISSQGIVREEFNQFLVLTNRIFINIKALYLATYTKKRRKYDFNRLLEKVHTDLKYLKIMLKEMQIGDHNSGELNVAPN